MLEKKEMDYRLLGEVCPGTTMTKKTSIDSQRHAAFLFSVVIPAYNEEVRLPRTLGLLEKVNNQCSMEVIVVCDGCTDKTSAVAREWQDKFSLRVITYSQNRGKGYAIQQGVAKASGAIIAFMDADGSTPPSELLRLASPIISADADIVIGSRRIEGALVKKQPLFRHLMGRLLSWITRNWFSLPYKDTQCGFKLFRRKCALALFEEMRCNGFEFDLEILYRAHQANMRISEIGVLWQDCSGSKVAPIRDGFKMLKAMLLIRYADLPFLYFRKLANQTRSQ